MTSQALEFENRVVLAMVQALVGSISTRMRAISLAARSEDETIDLHIAVSSVDETDEELIGESLFDFDGLTDGRIGVRAHFWVGEDWTRDWPGRDLRMIYAAAKRDPEPVRVMGQPEKP